MSARVYFNDSDRFRSEVQDGDLKVVTVLSGNRGWVEVAGTMLSRPVKQLSPLRNETLSLLRPDLLLLIFSRYRYSTPITEEGRSLEQLEVTGLVDGEYIRGRLSINLDTGLIEKYQYETERATRSGTGIFRERCATWNTPRSTDSSPPGKFSHERPESPHKSPLRAPAWASP